MLLYGPAALGFLFAVTTPGFLPDEELDHLVVLSRHGERYPLSPVPELGDFSLGALTPNGFTEEKNFGIQLSEWYSEFFEKKPTAHLASVNTSRCIDTAIAIMDGLSIDDYSFELLGTIRVLPNDVDSLLPLIEQSKTQVLPPCLDAALENIELGTFTNFPESSADVIHAVLKLLLADAVDTLMQSGYTGKVLGVDLATCVGAGTKVMGEDAFARLTDICRPSQCVAIISKLMDDLRALASENKPPRKSVSVYGLSDVHILDLLQSLLPQFNHTRPQFGGYILLELRGDDVRILTGQHVSSQPKERASLNIREVIHLLQNRVGPTV
ncbi:uncharacterized protein LOC100897217 [Galendromus occidentalis]|uniref:2-phosphoxylose phosphatase 1 n=1 Tax=Galendromus occidentalis TaxID=34638 RepID=A0AAJ7L802_9ACAR|nr:uncharacterized protein LOC100897217 [Galendromus occidentalis]